MSSAISDNRMTKGIALASIPAFPAVVLRVLDIVSQDDPDFTLLVREIASDATLSAQVLRLANSPLFGFAAQIGTVQHAVTALGTSQVQSLVMSVATANYSRAALRTEALQKCWRHTIATAVFSREVARAAGRSAEQAYSLGLLHDIGRLGLLVAWPDEYDSILQEADRDSTSLLDLEKRRFTMDHCEVGCLLVEQWKLPPEFGLVAGRHHDPPAGATEFDSLRIAHFACQMADSLGYWVSRPFNTPTVEELMSQLPWEWRKRFPSDAKALQDLVESSVENGNAALNEPLRGSDARDRSGPPSTQQSGWRQEPETGDQSFFKGVNTTPLVWDFMIVLTSVVTLVAVFAGLYFWL